MKIERFAGHHEAREALVLSIAGVAAIMLVASLILMSLADRAKERGSRRVPRAFEVELHEAQASSVDHQPSSIHRRLQSLNTSRSGP
jgi:hypothetical protein